MGLNKQPTKELSMFQKLILQDKYIKKLNQMMDEMQWDMEKKDRLIEMLESEIVELKNHATKLDQWYRQKEAELVISVDDVKRAKITAAQEIAKHQIYQKMNKTMSQKDQTIIQLRHELSVVASDKARLEFKLKNVR